MKKRVLCILTALSIVLALSGCGGGQEAVPSEYVPPQEDCLVLYTSHKKEVWWPIVKEFEERTGIWVHVVAGGSSELLEQIRREGENPKADLMFGGGVESLNAYRDCFEPYVCQSAALIHPQFLSPDSLWTPFSSLPLVLIYNTKLVDPSWLTGWKDLLSNRFAGRIAAADPSVSGSAFTGLVTCLAALGGEPDQTIRRLAANLGGRQLDSSGQVLSAVADGSCMVGVTLEETALQWMAAGEDLAIVYPADGTSSVPDGSALVKGAPHGDNARRFLDFTVSADVQQLLADRFYRRPVRSDVPVGEGLRPMDQIALVDYDVTRASESRDALLMSWAFYLGGDETP